MFRIYTFSMINRWLTTLLFIYLSFYFRWGRGTTFVLSKSLLSKVLRSYTAGSYIEVPCLIHLQFSFKYSFRYFPSMYPSSSAIRCKLHHWSFPVNISIPQMIIFSFSRSLPPFLFYHSQICFCNMYAKLSQYSSRPIFLTVPLSHIYQRSLL